MVALARRRSRFALEHDAVAHAKQSRFRAVWVEHLHVGSANEVPATRRGKWVHPRLRFGDCDRACGHAFAWSASTRKSQRWIELTEVCPSRDEPNDVDVVLTSGMKCDDLFGSVAGTLRNLGQVVAVVAHRNSYRLRGLRSGVRAGCARAIDHRPHPLEQLIETELERIVKDPETRICGHDFRYSFD